MTDNLRVVLVDDHQLVRSGVRAEIGDAVDVVVLPDGVELPEERITVEICHGRPPITGLGGVEARARAAQTSID